MNAPLIPINIVIGDRTYRIKIATGDEEQVRRIARIINDKIVEFKTQFAGQDMQDYVAMVLIWYATQSGGAVPGAVLETALKKDLSSLEDLLDKALLPSSDLPYEPPRKNLPPE